MKDRASIPRQGLPEKTFGVEVSAPEELRLARLLLDRAGDAVYWIDRRGRIAYANETAGRMLGYASDELAGLAVADIDPDVEARDWPRIWDELKARGTNTFQGHHRAKDGRLIPIEVSVHWLAFGGLELACGFVRDITDRRRDEASLQAALDEADRANRAKTRFLAAASHDLRQPLQAMELLATVLSDKVTDEEALSIIGDMRASLGLTRRLLNALLDISELEAGSVNAKIEAVPLAPLLGRIHQQYAVIGEDQQVDVRVVVSNRRVRSDPALLERILENLVSNAVRYSEKGRVLIGCRRAGEALRIEVWDSGPGIPAEQHGPIFEDFCQLDSLARERGAGLGLGLGIVRRLAALLDHRLALVSAPGRGSCFSIEVEAAAPATRAPAATSLPELIGREEESALILVIEDDALILEAMARVLQTWGHEVMTAQSAQGALDTIERAGTLPDLVVADYRLPGGKTGLEAVKALSERAGRALPALMVTGDIAPASLQDLSDSGLHVLQKPVRPAKLRALLRHLLAERKRASRTKAPHEG